MTDMILTVLLILAVGSTVMLGGWVVRWCCGRNRRVEVREEPSHRFRPHIKLRRIARSEYTVAQYYRWGRRAR